MVNSKRQNLGSTSQEEHGSTSLAGSENADSTVSELDDYICALMLQVSMISEDRETGQLGKAAVESDAQIAIEHMLQEAREMEQSYRLAKSLSTCESVPEYLFEEMDHQDCIAISDRELVERLERGESSAEVSLHAATERFQLVLQFFCTTAECCACNSRKQTYVAPCGHAYCEKCAQSLYCHALTNRTFIPARCCKVAFASELVAACLDNSDDIGKYRSIQNEIENPCPPAAELDLAASKLISEKGWRVCSRCGAVVDRVSGCVHMTCMCRHQFCYTCLKPWRTCRCELYPVAELNQILNERIGNDDPGSARHRLQNVLRNYYQHEHNWGTEPANGRACNVCRWAMPIYCMHCEVCMETRCQRCCFNN